MSWQEWLSIIAVVLAGGALALALRVHRHPRLRGAPGAPSSAGSPSSAPDPLAASGPVAFVVNPTKTGAEDLREAAIRACATRYLPEPLFFETTADEAGTTQALEAVAAGASAVVAAGGDGTVRAVAEALIGTDTPMGIVPLGTGNLLARNLDIPLTRIDDQLRIALTATSRAIDVGRMRVAGPRRDEDFARGEVDVPPPANEKGHLFLVIAGIGFDAAMVASTDEDLKARVGWVAYFLAGAKHINGRRLKLQIQLDDRAVINVRARTLLVGNCGRLPGGLTLLPDAEIDDGWLDIAAIDTRGGVAGWVQLFGEVVLQGLGLRNELPKIGRIDHARARTIRFVSERPVELQIDGESLGRAVSITAEVQHKALNVRAP